MKSQFPRNPPAGEREKGGCQAVVFRSLPPRCLKRIGWSTSDAQGEDVVSLNVQPPIHDTMYRKAFLAVSENPGANSFAHPEKTGYLQKLTGKGFLYPGTWKKRYCVLNGTRFYYYEKEDSKGSDRTTGCINLEFYDVCEEATGKDSKKAPNVFYIGTSDKSFFDSSNKYLFSADTLTEMNDWVRKIQRVMAKERNSKKPSVKLTCSLSASTPTSPNVNLSKSKHEDLASKFGSLEIPVTDRLYSVTKHRARGPKGRRLPQRKSLMPRTKLNFTGDLDSPYILDHRMRASSLSALEMESSNEGRATDQWLSHSIDLDDDQVSGTSSNHDLGYAYSSSNESLVHEALNCRGVSTVPSAALARVLNGPATTKDRNLYNLRLAAGGTPERNIRAEIGKSNSRQEHASESVQEYQLRLEQQWERMVGSNNSGPSRTSSPRSTPSRRDSLPRASGDKSSSLGRDEILNMGELCLQDKTKFQALLRFLNAKMSELLTSVSAVQRELNQAQENMDNLQCNVAEVKQGSNSASQQLNNVSTHVVRLEQQMVSMLKDVQSMYDKAHDLVLEAEKSRNEHTKLKEECEQILNRLRTVEVAQSLNSSTDT